MIARMPARLHGWHWCLVALAPVLVTLPRFWNDFVFDDVHMIVAADFIHHVRNLPEAFRSHAMIASSLHSAVGSVPVDTYRPLSIASFFFDAALSGRAPWSYHLTNTLLHAANAVLLLALLTRLTPTSSGRVRMVLTLAFGLAPWLSEAYVFINGRSDLLVTLGLLASLLAHHAYLTRGQLGLLFASGGSFLFALLSKETAVLMLPFLALLPVFGAPVSIRRRVLATLPLGLALAGYFVARMAALEGMRAVQGGAHLVAVLQNLPLLLWDGVFHIIVPTPYALRNLRDDYAELGLVTRLAATSSLVVVLAALAWAVLRRRAPVIVWGALLTLCTLSPSAMITTELWQGFGRYLYLPAIGITVLVSAALPLAKHRLGEARAIRIGVPVLYCALSALLLLDATLGYRDEITLYGRALARAPEQAWTVGSLGLAYKRVGQCPRAIPLLAHADRQDRREPRYAVHLARCLIEVNDLERARAVVRQGRTLHRDTRAEAGFLMAEFLTLARGQSQLAESLMRRCLMLQPGRADCQEGLQIALSERSQAQSSR